MPRCRIASRTVFPCGSSTASFGLTITLTFTYHTLTRICPATSARTVPLRRERFARISPRMQRIGWRIPAAWLTLCIVWSSTWLAIKVGLRDLPPVSFVALRFVVAIVVLIAVSIGRTRLLPKRASDYLILALTGVLMFGLNYTLLFWGELHVSSGLAAVLQATIPIFGMIFAHWMLPDEPLRLQKLLGEVVAIGGGDLLLVPLPGFRRCVL